MINRLPSEVILNPTRMNKNIDKRTEDLHSRTSKNCRNKSHLQIQLHTLAKIKSNSRQRLLTCWRNTLMKLKIQLFHHHHITTHTINMNNIRLIKIRMKERTVKEEEHRVTGRRWGIREMIVNLEEIVIPCLIFVEHKHPRDKTQNKVWIHLRSRWRIHWSQTRMIHIVISSQEKLNLRRE